MRRFGIFFLVLGLGSFVLPQFGIQFILVSWLDDIGVEHGSLYGGVVFALIGAILLLWSFRPQAATPPDPNRPPPVPQPPKDRYSEPRK